MCKVLAEEKMCLESYIFARICGFIVKIAKNYYLTNRKSNNQPQVVMSVNLMQVSQLNLVILSAGLLAYLWLGQGEEGGGSQ